MGVTGERGGAGEGCLMISPLRKGRVPMIPSGTLSLFTTLTSAFERGCGSRGLLLINFTRATATVNTRTTVAIKTSCVRAAERIVPNIGCLFFSRRRDRTARRGLMGSSVSETTTRASQVVFVRSRMAAKGAVQGVVDVLSERCSKGFGCSMTSLLGKVDRRGLRHCGERKVSLCCLMGASRDACKSETRAFGKSKFCCGYPSGTTRCAAVCIGSQVSTHELVSSKGCRRTYRGL